MRDGRENLNAGDRRCGKFVYLKITEKKKNQREQAVGGTNPKGVAEVISTEQEINKKAP